MNVLVVLGGAGGIVAVLGAIVIIGRGIFRQVSATENLADAVKELTGEVASLKNILNSHETRLAVLEDRIKR